MSNRRMEKRAPILKWFGNMSMMSDFLMEKSWYSPWGIAKFLNSFFRAFGVVAFAGSPLTGILVYIGLAISNPHVALGCTMTGIISILTCKMLKAPDRDVCDGVAVFNSILTGAVMTCVAPPLLNYPLSYHYWVFLAIAAVVTTFVDQGFQSMMAPSKLPVQSVPFNFVATILFLALRTTLIGFALTSANQKEVNINTNSELEASVDDSVNWNKVLEGTIISTGQVYGIDTIEGSIIIWLGYLLYSPLLTLYLYVGSLTGAVMAVMFKVPALSEIYIGLWSYNGMLAAGGIAFFVVPSPLSFIQALVTAVIASATQIAVTPLFLQTTVPVFSYPFNVAIMITLAISLRKESPLKFVWKRTFPEEHICRHYNICCCRNLDAIDEDAVIPLNMVEKANTIN